MKFFYTFPFLFGSLLTILAPQAARAESFDGYTYVWNDFSKLTQIPMTIHGGSLTDKGHINLKHGYVDLNFSNSIYSPSMANHKAFSIAITFAAGSIKNLATLFSASFYSSPGNDPAYLNGLFGAQYNAGTGSADIGYWTDAHSGQMFPSTISNLMASYDITVMFEQAASGITSLNFYAGRTLIASSQSTTYLNQNVTLGNLFIGGRGNADSGNTTGSFASGSEMTITGLGIRTLGTFDEDARQRYFDEVGVSPIPEPGSTVLIVLGTAGLAFRRRRSHA